jgi:hypothetical protein
VPLPPGAPNLMCLPSSVPLPDLSMIGVDTLGLPCVPLFGCGIAFPFYLFLGVVFLATLRLGPSELADFGLQVFG